MEKIIASILRNAKTVMADDPDLTGVALEYLVRADLLRTEFTGDPTKLPEASVFFSITDHGFEVIARFLPSLREEAEEIGLLIPGERPDDGDQREAYGLLVQGLVETWLGTSRALFSDGVQDVAALDFSGLAAGLGFDREWCDAITALRARGLEADCRDSFDRAEVMNLFAPPKGDPAHG